MSKGKKFQKKGEAVDTYRRNETMGLVGGCRCAYITDEWHGYGCEITGGECVFLYPNSKACAELYGEGPDAEQLNDSSETI